MLYEYEYFSLDTKSSLTTGNPFWLLVFLCKNGSGTVTEIGDYLDHAKDYDEEHLRQYRYKINTIIGHDVVEYKNGVYNLIGLVTDRNTDVIQEGQAKSEQSMQKVRFVKWPAILAVAALVAAIAPWPYGYFTLLRFVVTAVAIYYAYYLYVNLKQTGLWFWSLIFIAVLFNPIIPVHLGDKSIWTVIDIIIAGYFLVFMIKSGRKGDKHVLHQMRDEK